MEVVHTASEPTFTFSKLFGSMREGIIILRSNTTVSLANSAATEALSDNHKDLTDLRLSEILRDAALHAAFQDAVRFGRSSEVKIEVIDRTRRVFDVLVSPLNMSEDHAAIGVFYETTRIEQLERMRHEFLSNISHELRTPLTSILAFVETLADGAIDDEDNNRRFLDVIRRNAERMHLLINDISELSLIEAGKVEVAKTSIRLHKIVDEVFTNLSSSAELREIAMINDVPDTAAVLADEFRLEQMLTNLIDNAIKFNRAEGTVTVSLRSGPDTDSISVTDTGEGIRREHQERIFERLYRVDKARSREVGGTGLGLSIVKHLARLHGGEVALESIAGRGATFTIHLPK